MKLLQVLTIVMVSIALGAVIRPFLGLDRPNAQVLGVPLGPQTNPPRPAGDFSPVLRQAADDHGLTDWTTEPFKDRLSYSMSTRWSYYRATLNGDRDGEAVTVDVELRAAEGGQWQLSKWSER